MNSVISAGQSSISLIELRTRAAKFASGLHSLGLEQGSSIAIMMRNDIPYLEAMLGGAHLGVYAASINWHLRGEEVAFILNDCKAKVLVVHEDLVAELQGHLPANILLLYVETTDEIREAYKIPASSPQACESLHKNSYEWNAWRDRFSPRTTTLPKGIRNSIIYTSGTTGTPKGIRRQLTDENAINELQEITAQAYGLKPGIRVAMTGPLYHSATNAYTSQTLRLENDLILLPRFNEEELLQTIEKYRITHMHMVPTMFVRLLQLPEDVRKQYDLSSLECVVHGAAPCPAEVKKKMIEWWGPIIQEYYGSSEAGLITSISSADWLTHPGSVGKSLADTALKICTDGGLELPANEVGEIFIHISKARDFTYHEKPELREEIAMESYITNGDIGYLDDDGFLYICDRKKDMIISGGVNIYPAEIEGVLSSHPAVKDCAVFGIPNEEYGESIAVALETVAEISEEEVKAYIKSRLASYKVPRVVSFHQSLPREDSGKIFKRKIRDEYWQESQRSI